MLGNLSRLSKRESRSISAENMTGEKNMGALAREGTGASAAEGLGQGWKVSPCIEIGPEATVEIASVSGPGLIKSMWFTIIGIPRYTVLRIYWDHQPHPSVEVPIGDFFVGASGNFKQVSALPICVNPVNGYNSYFEMPFNKHCRITIENLNDEKMTLFYQINYEIGEIDKDAAYFHASFRRTNPLPYKEVYTIVDGIKGTGHYVGTYMYWQTNNNYWWGEGEIKFYLDGDMNPSICGTGTEDYFGGAWSFRTKDMKYLEYTTPYLGFSVDRIDNNNCDISNTRFNLYRFHVQDPIHFKEDLKVNIQALGWRSNFKRYLPLMDDISSVAYWYQTLPSKPFKPLADKDYLEII
ncbi:DUF2961 domain-containing protein [Acidaminobacter sp. JC074]|uniref:glycoside hydrolase family 172 protein n=1 Tax=Acidaminobacter sp. JC074 TaxID=2530199 RepID=UPI001F0D27A7|nr:glycoside hydrolase family 172 protein [Acidaminobacter sp. JC074]MCH4890137.1 DUF2961 domain-containing protein [Acidaminobacter sp. JC074]